MLNNHEQQILKEIEARLLENEVAEQIYGTVSSKLENHLRKNNFVIVNEMPKAKIRRILKFKYKDLITFLKYLSGKENLRDVGAVKENEIWNISDAGNEYLKKLEDFIKSTDESWLKAELNWIKTSIESYLVYEMGQAAYSNVISVMYVLATALEKEEI